MSYADTILADFSAEMDSTRKVLAQIPDDKFDWKAHPKSQTLGWNANHLAEIPGWVEGTLTMPFWDISPDGGEPYHTPNLRTTREILDLFDANVASAKRAIQNATEECVQQEWSLLAHGEPLLTMPRASVIRNLVLHHLIHHRGITCVYLRLNDIPVPGMYGPSGDEDLFAKQSS